MTDVSIMPEAKLRALIAETEETLSELKSELENREEAKQSQEIDNLDEHFRNAELSLQTIKDFFRYLAELRKS